MSEVNRIYGSTKRRDLYKLLHYMIMDGAVINATCHKESRLIVDGVARITSVDIQVSMKTLGEVLEDAIDLDPELIQELKNMLNAILICSASHKV